MMKFLPRYPQLLLRFRGASLPQLLTAAWWALLVLAMCLMATDIFIFYRYGVERRAGEGVKGETPIHVERDRIRMAAEGVRLRSARFESTTTTAAIPNPFR